MDRGVLNKYAIRLPRPAYPAEAKAEGFCGEVEVEVLVEIWTGRVCSARMKTGPSHLQDTVKKLVCGARFLPVVGEGPPIWVGGILKYTFPCRKRLGIGKGFDGRRQARKDCLRVRLTSSQAAGHR
jgi:hypothetical protein